MSKLVIFFFLIIFISLFLSFIMILVHIDYFYLEELYVKAITKFWYDNYPIVNVSLNKENDNYEKIEMLKIENTFCDCSHVENYKNSFSGDKKICTSFKLNKGCLQYDSSKKASVFHNKTLFVSYYKTNYWTLYDRIYRDKLNRIKCKDLKEVNYYQCGYLDIFKNPLCVIEGETCPFTNIWPSFDKNGNLLDITKIIRETNDSIINKIYASEIKGATLFDVNKIFTQKDINNSESREEEKYFWLYSFSKEINKSSFYLENNLTNYPFPKWFNDKKVYFYYLVYPGNLLDYPIRKRHINFFKKSVRLTLRILIFFFRIFLFFLILIEEECIGKKFINNKIIFIGGFIILTPIIYLILIILNIVSFEGRYRISRNLCEYLKIHYRKSISTGLTIYVFDIIETIIELFIIIIYVIIISQYYLQNNKKENSSNDIDLNLLSGDL